MDKNKQNVYLQILHTELIKALGCTEPIAVAYAAAKAKEVLGQMPEHVVVECSGNIVKNVKGVIVPTTNDMKGIAAAAAVGITGGDPALKLEVLTPVNEQTLAEAKKLLASGAIEEKVLQTPAKLHIIVRMCAGSHSSLVEIIHHHTDIVRIEKDGEVLLDVPHADEEEAAMADYQQLDLEDIYEFANTVPMEDIRPLFAEQVKSNVAIAKEGMKNSYGAQVGKTLMEIYNDCVETRAAAMAAAGSDARMSGCEMPVVINSGSGNQGITVSVPVYVFAKELGKSDEELYRALCFANLVAIYQKSKIGRLSAFCGAVNASTGAGAGIAYLKGMSFEEICEVIVNAIGGVAGIVCDGAKPSCAAKIAAGVQAAEMAIHMVEKQRGFKNGEGLVKEDAEKTLACICSMAKDGMETTDQVILELMVPSRR